MCKNCITLSGLKAEDSFQSLTQVKYIYKKKKRKKKPAFTCFFRTRKPAGIQPSPLHFQHEWSGV